jgi:glycerophosphoryl diester phosphodiesterase
VIRLAHRGDRRGATENTLPALLAAMSLAGVDGVELDVRASAEGEPILLHDPLLTRVHGRAVRARETPLAELQRHGVPHLADILAALPADAFLDIELKESPTAAMFAAIDAARGPTLHRAVVSSFEASVLGEVRARRPGWPIWLNRVVLNRFTVGAARAVGAAGVATRFPSARPAAVRAAHAAGLTVAVWGITDGTTRLRVEDVGVDCAIVEGDGLPQPHPGG